MSDSLQSIVCCMGQPVAGNPTQYMMEKCFLAAGLPWRYLTLEVPPENLKDALAGMRAMDFRGGNFTIPHKVAVIEHLDSLSEAAELMGAVNCVHHVDRKLIGENTDGKGFVQSLRGLTDPEGKKITVLGAGGAARAIAVELGLAGAASFNIVNRSQQRGEELTNLINERVKVPATYVPWEGDYEVEEDCEVLINATSIGLGDIKARIPLKVESLREGLITADVVFNPPKTQFLSDAEAQGCQILDGLGMLVNQAVIGFKIWTDVEPDTAIMREALEEFLGL